MDIRRIPTALVLLLATAPAMAHPGHGGASFFTGLAHPLGGVDHLLAILAVGFLAGRQRGAMRWALPVTFVAAMIAGAALGMVAGVPSAIDFGVGASVVVFGLAIALRTQRLPSIALPLVAGFAMLHGQAHAAEIGDAARLAYVGGIAAATAVMHWIGYLVARRMPESVAAQRAARFGGALVAAAGAVLIGA